MKHLKHISAELPVTFFKEKDQFVAFSPALDLSTCGKTFQEARERFAEAANLFLEETVKMGTLEEVLLSCGWVKVPRPQPHWVPPQVIAQVQEEVRIPVAQHS